MKLGDLVINAWDGYVGILICIETYHGLRSEPDSWYTVLSAGELRDDHRENFMLYTQELEELSKI